MHSDNHCIGAVDINASWLVCVFLSCDLIKNLDLKGDFVRLFCTSLQNRATDI